MQSIKNSIETVEFPSHHFALRFRSLQIMESGVIELFNSMAKTNANSNGTLRNVYWLV
jgi:hypothetical protein